MHQVYEESSCTADGLGADSRLPRVAQRDPQRAADTGSAQRLEDTTDSAANSNLAVSPRPSSQL